MSRSSNRIVVLTTAVWVAGMAGALVWLLWPTPRTPLPRGWRHWPETGKAVAVQLASDGVYVGGPHGLFHVADDNALSRIAIPDVPDAVMIYSLLVDREGRLWVGHNHGLSVRVDTHWQTFTAADVLPGVPVNALMQSRDGTIWLGTPKGALHLPGAPPWDDATGIRRLTRKDGLLEDVVFCLLEDAEGGIWFGNYIAPAGGLNRLKDGHWQHWTPRDGLPHQPGGMRTVQARRRGRLRRGRRRMAAAARPARRRTRRAEGSQPLSGPRRTNMAGVRI